MKQSKQLIERLQKPWMKWLPLKNLRFSAACYGLQGVDIPIEAGIVHVADVYDAITSDRAYRRAMSKSQVFELLEGGIGTQFNPLVMEAFMRLLHPEEEVCEEQMATI